MRDSVALSLPFRVIFPIPICKEQKETVNVINQKINTDALRTYATIKVNVQFIFTTVSVDRDFDETG